jgi:hypothetical protein
MARRGRRTISASWIPVKRRMAALPHFAARHSAASRAKVPAIRIWNGNSSKRFGSEEFCIGPQL